MGKKESFLAFILMMNYIANSTNTAMIQNYVFLRRGTAKGIALLFLLLFQHNLFAQPDLLVVESTLVNSMRVANLNNPDQCLVEEGCIGDLGPRQLVRFSTHIKNIGNQDFYVGSPPNSPAQANEEWEWDQCHNHWHYEGYAEYLVFDEFGNQTPIGVKNGFCLIDIECSGGGNFTYTCGNQGISAGCGDVYGSGLDCQWVDITDIPDGIYTLVVRVNWDQSPDFNGIYESSYDNNSTSVCFELSRNANNIASIDIINGPCALADDCNDVTLTINLDNYPEETSWYLNNSDDVTVAGGNHYDVPGTGTTVTELLCLPDGCYSLVFEDTQGDGICCDFGNGSYQLADGSGTILGTGGEFGATETINFCVQPPAPCTDEDGDGLCASEDCNDNDDTLPAPPGVACNDNDPDTENDIIQADGCSCAGTPISCPDADNDGICAALDCDDNDPAVPGLPGDACDDNDPNTENDVLQADLCTCAGTPINIGDPCENISIVLGANQIEILNLSGFPHINIQIFSSTWSQLDICVDDCGDPYFIGDLTPGIHYVSIKPFNAAWQPICDIFETVEVTGTSGPCTDQDGDGYCVNSDCDDNNPALPAAPGTACNDQNANTENDMIQGDGCTCQGTVIVTGDCASINIEAIAGGLNITGIASYPFANIQIFNENWQRVNNCSGSCNDPYLVNGLEPGLYHVSVKTFDANWQPACDVFVDINVTGQSGPCTDNDNDGVCDYDDCNDNDSNLPAAPGTACDDNDSNTTDDEIQSDGCTCQGTLPNPPSDCDAISIAGGAGTITVNGLGQYPHTSVQIQTSIWTPVSFCFDDCSDPTIESGLTAGDYLITIKVYDAGWTQICRIDETVTVLSNNLSTDAEFRAAPFEFDAGMNGTKVQLNWMVNNEYLTNRFELERSINGAPFNHFKALNNLGTSEYAKVFKSSDAVSVKGIYTYRVKQIFLDGSWRYSEVQSVDIDAIDLVAVFPNPGDQQIFIDLSKLAEEAKGQLTINSLGGRVIYSQQVEDIDAELFEFDSSELQSGVYVLLINIEGRKPLAKKIIITH